MIGTLIALKIANLGDFSWWWITAPILVQAVLQAGVKVVMQKSGK